MSSDFSFVALDLEFTQPSCQIIQVGVAFGDPARGVTSTASWFLDPGEPISAHIEQLTGIGDETIARHAVSFEQMAQELSVLIQAQPNLFLNPITWGGADSEALKAELTRRGIEFNHFGRRWIDLKTVFVFGELARQRSPHGGLSRSMGRYKLPFVGQAHRADVDASNTLSFFFHLLNREKNLLGAVDTIKSLVS